MDFTNKILYTLNIGGLDVWITESIVNTWIIMIGLIIFAVIVRVKLNSFKEIPTGFQNVIELIVETFDGFVRTTAGDKFAAIGNWFFMAFSFILISNLVGLVGLRPPTADWATTFAFAFMTLVLIQVMGLWSMKGGYLKSFIEPTPIFLPLNIIGELARPVSLSFRLFGNILSGVILTGLLYSLAPIYVQFVVPVAVHAFFDIFTGVLQTYIFCVLSMTFIGAVDTSES